MLSKKGSLKRPSTTSSEQVSQCDRLTQSDPLMKPHQGIKKTEEKSTLTCPARTGNAAPPSGSSNWMGEKWLDTPKMMQQGNSHSLPTSLPPKNTTMRMMTTLQGPCQSGSYPLWWEAGPPSPQSGVPSTNSPATIGVLWLKLIDTEPWTNSAKCCALKSTSSSRKSRQLRWSGVSAKGDSKRPGQIIRSATCDWVKQEPDKSRTVSGQTWYARTTDLTMDVGIHSDRESGVTGLG